MYNLPIIRLEIQRMQHNIYALLNDELLKMDKDLRAAIENVCTPEHIKTLVQRNVDASIENAIRTELDNFFRNGQGRKLIRKAIEDKFATEESL